MRHAMTNGLLDSWMNGLADFRLKAWPIVAVGFTRVCAHGGRLPDYICPAGAIQRGIKSFWPALSGRENFCMPVPRPMASATMVEAFGLDSRTAGTAPGYTPIKGIPSIPSEGPCAKVGLNPFEPIGNRREEFGEAEGRMATERAGASESIEPY